METLTSSLSAQYVFPVTHASDISAARRAGQKLADALGFDAVRAGRLAIIVTEAGTNILKHAGEGTLYIMPSQTAAALPGVDVVAIDNGPGIADLAFSLQDGVSTAGTAGTGLGRCAARPTNSTSGASATAAPPSSCASGRAAHPRRRAASTSARW
jgi:anti-sigma regulatory factor (Ser/Thr protein kinase)